MKSTATLFGVLAATISWGGFAAAQPGLSMWYHGAGGEVEGAIIRQIVDDFNASQGEYSVALESFPQESYNDSIVAAALAGNLPDIIDVDGPVMPHWAWANYMQPLTFDESLIADFLPGTIGRWDGAL